MKRILRTLFAAALLTVMHSCTPAYAQTSYTVGPAGSYSFSRITAAGPLTVINFGSLPAAPSNHTFAWKVRGTAPTACTIRLEGSITGLPDDWFDLSGTYDCTSSTIQSAPSVPGKPWPMVRLYVITYTAGDGTTAVTAEYSHGGSN